MFMYVCHVHFLICSQENKQRRQTAKSAKRMPNNSLATTQKKMVSNITLQQQHLNVYTCNAAVQIKFLTLLSIRTCTGTYINIYINTRTKDQKIQEQI